MAEKDTKLEKMALAMERIAVSQENMAVEVAKIQTRLDVMEENFARKIDVEKNAAEIIEMRNAIQTLDVREATNFATLNGRIDTEIAKVQLKMWGAVGSAGLALVCAVIGLIQMHA